VPRLLLDHPEHEQPKLAVVERPATALAAPNVSAAMFVVAIVTVFAVFAVMAVFVVVAMPPAVAPMHIFGAWTVSGVPLSVLHQQDITLVISIVKIYLDTIFRGFPSQPMCPVRTVTYVSGRSQTLTEKVCVPRPGSFEPMSADQRR
jgi:hypothetical protein